MLLVYQRRHIIRITMNSLCHIVCAKGFGIFKILKMFPYCSLITSLLPIRRVFAPGFVNYKKGALYSQLQLIKVYQLLAHGRRFSPGTPASSTSKMGRHDTAEILLKVALNTINQST